MHRKHEQRGIIIISFRRNCDVIRQKSKIDLHFIERILWMQMSSRPISRCLPPLQRQKGEEKTNMMPECVCALLKI